jgi:ZIP family zinc transporter
MPFFQRNDSHAGALAPRVPPWLWRGACAAAIGCVLLLLLLVIQALPHDPKMRAAMLGGGVAALATGLGTLPVLFSRTFSQRAYDCFLGFGSGVMLAACSFSLIIPALAFTREQGFGPMASSLCVGGGILLGGAALLLLERLVPPPALTAADPASAVSLRRAWLFVLAVTLHNMPEGLAIGVAYAGVAVEKANTLASGISIQDIPEGLVVALALRSVGYSRGVSAGLGVVSGLIEPVAAVAGVLLVGISAGALPWGLAAAAGAMLFVISHDVVPEAHRSGNGTAASCALLFGFVLMTVLDTALG